MTGWQLLSAAQGASPSGKDRVRVRVKKRVKLVFFPGDRGAQPNGTLLGTIYVVGGEGEKYEAAGGPPPKEAREIQGHFAGPTPARTYVMAAAEHHTTLDWPGSVIPWGAPLRQGEDGQVEFQVGGVWRKATGSKGEVTAAQVRAEERARRGQPDMGSLPLSEIQREIFMNRAMNHARVRFFDGSTGKLISPTWKQNDFGVWAWNLTRDGARSTYYVHTTPDDEKATEEGTPVSLAQSHGCIHLRPKDRDEMMEKGYLAKGVVLIVKPYTDKGPP